MTAESLTDAPPKTDAAPTTTEHASSTEPLATEQMLTTPASEPIVEPAVESVSTQETPSAPAPTGPVFTASAFTDPVVADPTSTGPAFTGPAFTDPVFSAPAPPADEATAPRAAHRAAAALESSEASEARESSRWRARRRMAVAGAAALFLVGSVMVATPANAATVQGSTVYADQLLAHGQTLHVSSAVENAAVETQRFSSDGYTLPNGSEAVTVGGNTNIDWAALVLEDANLPVTTNNLTVMLQWMDSENDPHDWYLRNNPLNNGLGSGGGAGFGSYANLSIAASYVAQQLNRSDGLFSGIHAALAADSPVSVTAQAIWDSAWAGSHYGYGSIWHAVDVPIVAAPSYDWD